MSKLKSAVKWFERDIAKHRKRCNYISIMTPTEFLSMCGRPSTAGQLNMILKGIDEDEQFLLPCIVLDDDGKIVDSSGKYIVAAFEEKQFTKIPVVILKASEKEED